MIVRLTRRQYGRVIEIILDQMPNDRWRDGVAEWWAGDVTDASKHRVDVAMPAIAWKRVWEVLFDHCFDHRGMRTKGVRATDLNAAKAIRRALNVREIHPALAHVAALGMISELIPAWRLEEGEAHAAYDPYPRVHRPFVVLAPERRTLRGQVVTQWVESNHLPQRRMLDPAEHIRFT